MAYDYPTYLSPEALQAAQELDSVVPERQRLLSKQSAIDSRLKEIDYRDYPDATRELTGELVNNPELSQFERIAWIGAFSVNAGHRVTFKERHALQRKTLTRLERVDKLYGMSGIPVLGIRNLTRHDYSAFQLSLRRTTGTGLRPRGIDDRPGMINYVSFNPETEEVFEHGDSVFIHIPTRSMGVQDLLATFPDTNPDLARKALRNIDNDEQRFRIIGAPAIAKTIDSVREMASSWPSERQRLAALEEAKSAWLATKATKRSRN